MVMCFFLFFCQVRGMIISLSILAPAKEKSRKLYQSLEAKVRRSHFGMYTLRNDWLTPTTA